MKILQLLCMLMLPVCSTAQHILPEAGKAVPEFRLVDVHNAGQSTVIHHTFKGKWLFLDFWTQHCVVCIKRMPKISALHEQFKNEATFLMVGQVDNNEKIIKNIYERQRTKHDLKMPYAFDPKLMKQWGISAVPLIVIIDPKGIVYAVTDGRDLTAEKVRDILNGKKVSLWNPYVELPASDPFKPVKNPEEVLIYQSSLRKWNGEGQHIHHTIRSYCELIKTSRYTPYKADMYPLGFLYITAYSGSFDGKLEDTAMFGRVYPTPVLEMSDPSAFTYDFNQTKGLYSYSLILPPAAIHPDTIMKIMQRDLQNAFGYNARIEVREMPVMKLVVISPKLAGKLKAKKPSNDFGQITETTNGGLVFTDYSVKSFLTLIGSYLSDARMLPYIDFTGITDKIDLRLDAETSDINEVRAALQKNGLDLVEGLVKMRAVVIRQ